MEVRLARDCAWAFSLSLDPDAGSKMRAAIAESFPEIVLETVADYLILPASRVD